MATIRQLAEQAHRILDGGYVSADSQFDRRELELEVSQQVGRLVKLEYWNQIKSTGLHGAANQFIVPFKLTVYNDEDRDKDYANIPQSYISLPGGHDVYSVSPIGNENQAFIQVKTGFINLTGGLRVGRLENKMGFYVEAGKIWFTKKVSKYIGTGVKTPQVLVRLAVTNHDQIQVDPAMASEAVSAVVQLYSVAKQIPQDDVNNNSSNDSLTASE